MAMRWAADEVLRSLKDQVRVVRYSIRAEAEAPGSVLPKALHDLPPVKAIGGPALRLADGLFREVGTLATELLVPSHGAPAFPLPIGGYVDGAVVFSDHFYPPYKAMLAERGVGAALVSGRALDEAGERFRGRQGDLIPRERAMTPEEVAQAGATLIRALAEARPIRKLTFGAGDQPHAGLMLAPNLYCAMVAGIAVSLVSLKPELAEDRQAVADSARSVADVRLHRFNRALTSADPDTNLAKELEVLLPFLP